jgi:hypothetical protein
MVIDGIKGNCLEKQIVWKTFSGPSTHTSVGLEPLIEFHFFDLFGKAHQPLDQPLSYHWFASLVEFPAFSGMTAHKDFSYNRFGIGTIVLSGRLYFGASDRRETAHERMVTLGAGDMALLSMPFEDGVIEPRPYFCAWAPERTLAIRTSIRKIPHES